MYSVTKVREHADVGPVDHAELVRLAPVFNTPGVVAASLVGSQARGTAGPLSDVDLAVWVQPGLEPQRRHTLALSLTAGAAAVLGTDEIDLVTLNDASPLMRHTAVRDGIRFVERDQAERVRLEARALLDYLDTAPLRATLATGVTRRIAEGRFGRR